MALIKSINAYEILDSRGNPTVKCDCLLDNGIFVTAAVPSGASTGSLEAYELRDKDMNRYAGKGVLQACSNINNIIADKVIGMDPVDQKNIDYIMLKLDNTPNLMKLGANAILAVSMAVAKAAAKSLNKELYEYLGNMSNYSLPVPFMNILNGGSHANNNIDIQEFMIVPTGFSSFAEALRAGVEIYHKLSSILAKQSLSTSVGDEGGFAPNLVSTSQVFDIMGLAIKDAGYTLGKDIYFAIDVAASEFYKDGYYILSDGTRYDSKKWVDFLVNLTSEYPIISIEDGMAEDDFDGWLLLTNELGKKIQLVGDDLFVTQAKVLQQGINAGLANSILIKPNQVGSLTGTLQTIAIAKQESYSQMISHRSGETCDTIIADIAVATNSGQIKTGAPCRGERLAKYNRLLEIESILGNKASYAGESILPDYIKNKV